MNPTHDMELMELIENVAFDAWKAALPKRPTPVKVEPTAEELEEAEAEKAWLKWGDAGERHSFMGGWKAARAGRYCVGLNSGTVSHDDSTVDYGKAR